jgi:signal transduction histidine kinase
MSLATAFLGLIVVAQGAALLTLGRSRRAERRRADEHARCQREAGAIAHDFNNLLALILNYASFLQEDLAEDDARRHDVEEIRRAAQQAGVLSRSLLASSRSTHRDARGGLRSAEARPPRAPGKRVVA